MGRREVNKRLKRERLLREGLKRFLEVGYERASVEQIAAAAGVARGTFYLYFDDKRALFQALMDGWHQVVLGLFDDVRARLATAETSEEAWQVYRDMGAALVWVGLANRDEILLAFRESRSSTEAGALLRAWELQVVEQAVRFTEVAVERGLIDVANPRIAVLVVLGAAERLFYEVLLGTDLGDVAQVAQEVVGLFERAMQARIP